MTSWAITLWRFSGVIGVILAWIVIALSISQNPWSNILRHALSDLGDTEKACNPWIYNVGLMVIGSILCIYSIFYTYRATGKVCVFASALLFVAGIFLALIDIYPSGTGSHIFVSTWFFIQTWLALVALTIGMMLDKGKTYTIILSLIAVVGPLGAILVEWSSVVLLEIHGVILINIYIAMLTTHIK